MNWRSLPRKVADLPARYRILAWLLLALVAAITLSPISLRPTTSFGPDAERAAAFVLVGFVFCLTYPRRSLMAGLLLIVACAGLEYAQQLVPGRHADFDNFLVKSAGIVFGIFAGKLIR